MNKYFYKILFSALLLMLFGSKISAQSIPELLYYKFDGIGNTVPNMASAPPLGTGTATILGAITQGGTGQCGGALIGSGISATTDYLNTGWATNLTGTSWTISFWSSNITPSATLYYIFGDVSAGSFRCFTNGVAGPNNWILRGGFSDVLITGGATVAPHMNTWVYDMSLGNIKAYLDGILVNTVVQAGPTIAGPGPFKVMGYSSNIGAPLGGLLDEFRVYNHALSAAEVMNLYTSVTASASNLTICAGGSTTLTGTNATNYTWNPGNIVGNNILVSPLTTTTYTVTGNDAGCASTATVTITVTPLPNVTASASPAAICSGESSILTGGGANTYLWQPGNLAGSPSVSPLATTTYTVTGTDVTGCSSSATVIVAINPVSLTPNPVTATPAAICAGGTAQLNSTAAVGNVQSWYTVPNGGVAIGTSLSGVDFPVTPAVTTTYYAENLDQVALGGTQTFNFTGGMQTFTVPAGVTQITILAKGAQGAAGANGGGNGFGGAGGLGSSAEGILNVVPGDVLNIFVGGQASGGTGGFNGGGNGGNLLAGGGGGASDVRLNSILAANRVIVGAGGGGGGTGGCAVPNVNGGNGGHGNANGTNGITSPNGGGGFAASGATFGAAGIGCAGFLGSPGTSAINEVGGNGGNGQGCCCASTPGGGGGGGGFIGGGGAGGGSAGTVGCIGNDKGGGGGGAGGSSFTGALLSPVLVTGVQSGNGQVVLTWSGGGGGTCPSVRVPVTVTVNPPSPTPNPVTATPAVLCAGGTSQLNSTAAAGNVQSWYTVPNGGVAIGTSLSGVDFPVTPAVTTTYYAENLDQAVLGGTQTFNFTGGMQTFTVPAGITQITILAKGAQGAAGANGGGNGFGGAGGLGSSAEGILNVVPGDVLNIFVGGQASGGTGGFNGGGNGGNLLAGGGGGASDVRLNSILAANRVIVGAGGGGGGTGGCAVPNVNGGNGGHGNANGTNGITSPNGGGGFAASGATFGAAGIGCAGFLGSPGTSAINEVGGNGGNGQGCCCASTPGGGGGGGGFIGGGGAGGGSAGTVGCIGNDKGGGGGGAGGSSFTGALLSPVLVTGVQSGNGQVVLTWSGGGGTCPSVRVPVTVTVNPAPAITATATPATTCTQTVVTPSASGAPTIAWTGGVTNNIPFIANATTTYTVTGTDGIGCTASTTVLVTVNPMSGILAPASSNQSQDHGDDFNVNYYDASCDLIATVDDGAGGNILGLTTSTVTVDPGFGVHNGQPFVRRWYQITPTNNGSADVVLYINQSDFDNYNLGVALPYLPLPTSGNNADPNISNIRITKNTDAGLGNSPVVITPTVNWNGTYWELSFNTPGFSQFRVHSVNPGNVPLPTTVTNFGGVKLESSDKLSWTTSSEQNNAYFNLQHSTDGTNFTTLAKVNSKAQNGNSSVALNYSSINNKPSLGHNYYRLQQVDMDGKVSVHAQIVDLIWGATGSTVSIYPNPTTDILNIDLYAVKDQNTTVKLLDMSGRVIKQIQAKSAVGMNNIKLSMDEIASGVYTIQVYENNTLSHTSKVKKND